MKTTIAILTLTATACFAQDYHSVDGHYRKDGVYVPPHYQTNPDRDRGNNWSSAGNTNPITGRPGTVDPNRGNNGGGFGNDWLKPIR